MLCAFDPTGRVPLIAMDLGIFGATGMVGQGVLRESLLAADVEQVLAVVRTPTGVRHPKLREALLTD
ncbi:MAG: hypothetical protein M3394_09355, partial [Actinomycetota bacterium]|nr:hypothetical protein [Actinomycetota bacterium]